MVKRIIYIIIAVLSLLNISCDFPYGPHKEPPVNETRVVENAGIKVTSINTGEQICNPSISQDIVNFKGCMLWLNFGGELKVNVPATMTSFNKTAVQHDRLTITDSSNTVRWFMMLDELGASEAEQIQDPEWSAHPEYIAALVSSFDKAKWSCVAIHPMKRHFLTLCNQLMIGEATPHLWVPRSSIHKDEVTTPAYDANGFVDKGSVRAFFGTDSLKIVYCKKIDEKLAIYFIDYARDTIPRPLIKPSGKNTWNCESPLISPDGKWIVYNAFQTVYRYESYIQELREDAQPILIKSGASDPHWWINPDNKQLTYIVYQEVPGSNFVEADLALKSLLESGTSGTTSIQQVFLSPGLPKYLSFANVGTSNVLVKLPLKGGLSPDGHYLCTGYRNAYIVSIR